MKVIFNHSIVDWYWQIYDEWSKNHELVVPDNYKKKDKNIVFVDLNALEKCISENSDADFIFDFVGEVPDLIRWKRRGIKTPLVILVTNLVGRRYVAKRSIYTNLWYVNANAKSLIKNYNVNNLIYEGMAANSYIYHPIESEKKYDITFFGRFYGDRSNWLNTIKNFCSKKDIKYYFPLGDGELIPWSFEDINKLYNQTKINLSFAQKNFIKGKTKRRVNLRTFEICMSGNFQLLQYTPCIEEYFEIDKEVVCWKNKKELFEKLLYYLENDDEREKIARNGYKRAIENHTWSKRLESIANHLQNTKSFNIEKYKIYSSMILEKHDIDRFNKLQLTNSSKKLLEFTLKELNYKTKRHIRKKKFIKVELKKEIMNYNLNLNNFHFIKLKGKILMVINCIPYSSKINLNDWSKLEEVLYLTENYDSSLPQFGLLTNGIEWIIQDFKNRKWLKKIPNRMVLNSCLNSRNQIKRIFYSFKNNYKRLKLDKLLNFRLLLLTLRKQL